MEERRASLQIATPHCGVTPTCYDTAPASPEWCPRESFSSPSSLPSLAPLPLSTVLLHIFPPRPALPTLSPFARLADRGRAEGPLHACKTRLYPDNPPVPPRKPDEGSGLSDYRETGRGEGVPRIFYPRRVTFDWEIRSFERTRGFQNKILEFSARISKN